jgi:hypothetical protein
MARDDQAVSSHNAGPVTIQGRWIRADVRGDSATRDSLPEDDIDADADAGAVIQAAFELAVARRFAPDCHVRDIALLASGIKRRYGHKTRIPVREIEVLVREALGEQVPTDEIDATMRYVIMRLVFEAIVDELGLFDPELDALLVASERMAVERGFNPTRAP